MKKTTFVRWARRAFAVGRWWFGLTYILAGAGAVVAGPVMIARGNYGGVYMLVGAPIIAAMGWVIHPWGLQRTMRHRPLSPQGAA